MNTPATCWMPARWRGLAASRSSLARAATRSVTRTGNVEQPVRGRWDGDWQPLKDGAVASPAGRYLQWKAVLHAGGALGGVGVNYLPVNAAPVVDEMVVVPGARLNPQSLQRQRAADGEYCVCHRRASGRRQR